LKEEEMANKNKTGKLIKMAASILLLMSPCGALAEGTMKSQEPPAAFCDEGMFLIGNTKYTFEDVILEANAVVKLNEKGPVTAYGYIADLLLPSDPLEPTHASFFGGNDCKYEKLVFDEASRKIALVVAPQLTSISEDQYKEIRRTMMRSFDMAGGTALLKFTGKFGFFSDSKRQYFLAEGVEVVSARKQ
jgi:hypothetical protein